MKKRSFLLPVAVAIAALAATNVSASIPPTDNTTIVSVASGEFVAADDLVLERSAAPTVNLADHASHSSHANHVSSAQ